MTTFGRIRNIIAALLMIAGSIVMVAEPSAGFYIAAGILSLMLIFYGVRKLVYYFVMARHMVGGRIILYMGVLIFDLGIFTLTLSNVRPQYVMIYLIAIHAVTGVISILGALEAKKQGDSSWIARLIEGVVNIIVAVICGIFIGSQSVAVYIFSAGLIYSAIMRFISALRRTAIIYIQ